MHAFIIETFLAILEKSVMGSVSELSEGCCPGEMIKVYEMHIE